MENRETICNKRVYCIMTPKIHINELFVDIAQELEEVDKYLNGYFIKDEDLIKNSFIYLLNAGGKRLRPAFALLASRYGDKKGCVPVAAAIELVHMVSLIHDDVIDAADLRRGKPTIHVLSGNKFSVHLGDYLFAQALAIIDEYQQPELSAKLAYASMEMCRGEIEQLSREKSFQQSIKNYLYRINKKTAVLIKMSFEAGALVSGARPDIVSLLGNYGHNIGMAFQITDDILDCMADEDTLGKTVGNDINNGILTLPLIYFFKLADRVATNKVKNILSKESISKDESSIIKELLIETQALEYSQMMVNQYVLKALRQLDKLPENRIKLTFRQIANAFYNYHEEVV